MITHFIISKSEEAIVGEKTIKLTEDTKLTLQGEDFTAYEEGLKKMIIIGDLVDSKKTLLDTPEDEIPKLRGNFYAIVVANQKIKIFTSFLSVLPLYYTSNYEHISSSIPYLKENLQHKVTTDKKFILESLLFNYGFFNRTLFKEISLVPSNHFVEINSSKTALIQHFKTNSLYTKVPVKGKKTANELSDLFIGTTKHYFPDDPFYVAFTSGFDGRTLLSCATHYKKKFKTFSFGRIENDDVAIPRINAASLGVPYQYFDLGDAQYTKKNCYENAEEYIYQLPGGNGLIYSHFLHSTKQIAKDSKYLISGVVGSELFRALHLTGAVTSQALVDVFTSANDNELSQKIKDSKALKAIKREEFSIELQELIEELIAYKSSIPKHYTPNQQFYVFVFEEIFRKFFGQWIYLQMHYMNVRTPFLDLQFIEALLKSQFAGANNDFFTENPLKRMKGQFLYADIIKKTNKKIYHQKTGKGYRPKDVRESLYLFNIILPFVKKRLNRKVNKVNLDNLGIISGALSRKKEFLNLIEQTDWIDKSHLAETLEKLTPYTNEKERDTLLMTVSLIKALQEN